MTTTKPSTGKSAAVAERISAARQRIAASDVHNGIPRRGKGIEAASFAQERMWLLDRLVDASEAYNMTIGLRVMGAFDTEAFARSLNRVIERILV